MLTRTSHFTPNKSGIGISLLHNRCFISITCQFGWVGGGAKVSGRFFRKSLCQFVGFGLFNRLPLQTFSDTVDIVVWWERDQYGLSPDFSEMQNILYCRSIGESKRGSWRRYHHFHIWDRECCPLQEVSLEQNRVSTAGKDVCRFT